MEYPGLEDANFEQQITMAIHQWMKQRMCDTVYVGRHFKVTVMRLGTLWPLEMGPDWSPEMSATSCPPMPC